MDEPDNISGSPPDDISKLGEEKKMVNFRNIKLPKTNKRCFKPNWMEKYPWIEYSVTRDAVFCYICRQFKTTSMTNNPDTTFTTKGFNNWKKALETARGFLQHENCAYHLSANAAMHEKLVRQAQNKNVSQLLTTDVLNLRRCYIDAILDVVIFLATKELAFRGNWDAVSKKDSGLFLSLFDYTLDQNEKLRKAVKIIPKNAKYTSPGIQNDLIAAVVSCVRQHIVEKVNSANYFTLFVDGTKDLNAVECISIAARYILDGKPVESVLGMEVCYDLSAVGISTVILTSLKKYGVDTGKMISQCYDGAFVMSGDSGGVQTILQEKFDRRIPYVHCFSHRLHLVIIAVASQVKTVEIYFDQLRMIYKFFKKYKVRKLYEGTPLKRNFETSR